MRRSLLALLIPFCLAMPQAASAEVPIVTDSRIKTLVYNPNEVYTITTHYGYQSNIEFGLKETIETVSVGDRIAWQIIPAGRRLFIRAQESNAHTNMTIVTNRRAYQFDLRSSSADAVFGSEELTYVVRFYYPDEQAQANPASYRPEPAPLPVAAMPEPGPAPVPAAVPAATAMPVPTGAIPPTTRAAAAAPYNYRYTFSGPNASAPVKIYDDGRSTYFKFRSTVAPRFAVITAQGDELTVPARKTDATTYAVDMVAPRFSLRNGGAQVVVYNESSGA